MLVAVNDMTDATPLVRFRNAAEDDGPLALDRAHIETPLSDPCELLEFLNRMLDVVAGSMTLPISTIG